MAKLAVIIDNLAMENAHNVLPDEIVGVTGKPT
jgi:hypothetical protein